MASHVYRFSHLAVAVASAATLAAGCGRFESRHDSSVIADEIKQEMFTEPTTPLTPSSPQWAQPYSVYSLVDAKFAVDARITSISARVEIQSTAGKETVELVGALRPDGSASLIDLAPMADGKNRLVGEALCADVGVCQKIILNVYYNVAGKTLKKQFSSDSLKADAVQPPAPVDRSKAVIAKDDAQEPEEQAGDFVGPQRNESLIGKLWKRGPAPELPPAVEAAPAAPALPAVPAAPAAPTGPKAGASAPAANVLPTKAAQPKATQPKAAQPKVTPKLVTKSAVKPVPAAAKAMQKPASSVTVMLPPVRPATPAEEKAAAAIIAKKIDATKPSAPQPGYVMSTVKAVANYFGLVPQIKTPQKPALPRATKTSSNEIANAKASESPAMQKPASSVTVQLPPARPADPKTAKPIPAPPAPPPVRRPLPRKPQPEPIHPPPGKPVAQANAPVVAPAPVVVPAPVVPVPAVVPPSIAAPDNIQPDVQVTSDATLRPEAIFPDLPFAPAQVDPSAQEIDQKIQGLELRLAPLINLRDGGQAFGAYGPSANPKSSILNANLLTPMLGLVPVRINANAHYGTGMLVSFLENAAAYLFKTLGLTLFVGDMSLKNGGSFGPSSAHNTHRNGLDADIAWLGIEHPLVDSALDRHGKMVSNFDYKKTWEFLTLAGHQELIYDAEKTSAISRIYMSQPVKAGFCKWTKSQGLYEDEFNQELLQFIRPTPNHVKHFHLSLKCSPYYPLCRNLAPVPAPGPGC